jgi:hypothetical protein
MQLRDLRKPRHIAVASLLLAFLVAWGWLTYTVVSFGMLTVRVKEATSDLDLAISCPGAIALVVLPLVPADALREAGAEIERAAPIVHAVLAELKRSPDFTLVSVEECGERVNVHKRGGNLLVEVDDGDTSVRVKLPLRTADYVLSRLAAAGPA